MQSTPLLKLTPSRDRDTAAQKRQQHNRRKQQAEAMVIESPADQSWIAFCGTLAAPVMLLPDMDWIES